MSFNPEENLAGGGIMGAIESGYDSIGLMRGPQAPMKRALFTGGVIGSLVYIAKPSAMFDSNGEQRPWSLLEPENPNSTTFPFYLVPVVGGFLGGFLI